MKKLNTKLKLLSMALVGLGGLGLAGGAFAACPGVPGAWSSASQTGGTVAFTDTGVGGFDGTACRMDSTIDANAGFITTAFVTWDGAQEEPRYRAQFIIDASVLAAMNGLDDQVKIFSAGSLSGSAVDFRLYGVFGSVTLDYMVYLADGTSVGGTATLPTSGPVHVEFDLQTASSAGTNDGYFKLWVESNNEGAPTTDSLNLANYGMGVGFANLGLADAFPGYISQFGGTAVAFDQFDSRRNTFIGF